MPAQETKLNTKLIKERSKTEDKKRQKGVARA